MATENQADAVEDLIRCHYVAKTPVDFAIVDEGVGHNLKRKVIHAQADHPDHKAIDRIVTNTMRSNTLRCFGTPVYIYPTDRAIQEAQKLQAKGHRVLLAIEPLVMNGANNA